MTVLLCGTVLRVFLFAAILVAILAILGLVIMLLLIEKQGRSYDEEDRRCTGGERDDRMRKSRF